MAKAIYQPPQQSVEGQWIDVIVLLGLIFLALFAPVIFHVAVPARVEKLPPGVSYEMKTTTDARRTRGVGVRACPQCGVSRMGRRC